MRIESQQEARVDRQTERPLKDFHNGLWNPVLYVRHGVLLFQAETWGRRLFTGIPGDARKPKTAPLGGLFVEHQPAAQQIRLEATRKAAHGESLLQRQRTPP